MPISTLCFLGILLIAPTSNAQRVDVAASVGISITTVDTRGAAQFYNLAGDKAQASISGFLTLFESGYDVMDYPWTGFGGSWQGGFTYHGDYGYCYTAGIDGHGTTTATSTSYSQQACTGNPPSPPPSFHGADLCPLVIDLEGDGIPTTGLEDTVSFFDANHDGVRDPSGWTSPYSRDAFLWMDLNGNGVPDPGELFGAWMPMPDGGYARNGFEALLAYDEPEYGGNGDGMISRDDAVWGSLRLWTDLNHDGRSNPHEISTPGAEHVIRFDLAATPIHHVGGNGNVVMFAGWSEVRLHDPGATPYVVKRRVIDISFIPAQ